MTDKKELLDTICGIMYPGALYPVKVIKSRYMEIFNDIDGLKFIAALMLAESRKKNSKVVKVSLGGTRVYKLNEKFDHEEARSVVENETINRLAAVIMKTVQTQNLKILKKWLDEDLNDRLEQIVTEKLAIELKDEVAPLIAETVNAKIKCSRGKFKKLLLEVICDIINLTEEDEV